MTITPLSDSQFEQQAHAAFRNIFAKDLPFEDSFGPWVKNKEILFEDSYIANGPLFKVVAKVASELGEDGFYVSLLLELGLETPEHWYISLDDATKYNSIFKVYVENVAFSEKGDWGIMFSPDSFAVIGGTDKFMTEFRKHLPDIDMQVIKFLDFWEYEASLGYQVDWLPDMLHSVYGNVKAERLLQKYKILGK